MPSISVIICTHNPRMDYIDKVLSALKSQSLSQQEWELLLVDNASKKILSSEIELNWHLQYRYIREDKLGLTSARLRGISEAKAETLVFVDDDNVLASDYLEAALKISQNYPFIGAWGGQVKLNFEVLPPNWTKPYWAYLGVREFQRDIWSNLLSYEYDMTPCGAGICVRRIVAEKYASLVRNDFKRLGMDRRGKSLMSCGDTDLALTACDIGLGIGQFTSLNLDHLIPATRVQEEYFAKLVEGMEYSHKILDSFRGKKNYKLNNSWKRGLFNLYKWLKMTSQERRIHQARQNGINQAIQEIASLEG